MTHANRDSEPASPVPEPYYGKPYHPLLVIACVVIYCGAVFILAGWGLAVVWKNVVLPALQQAHLVR